MFSLDPRLAATRLKHIKRDGKGGTRANVLSEHTLFETYVASTSELEHLCFSLDLGLEIEVADPAGPYI